MQFPYVPSNKVDVPKIKYRGNIFLPSEQTALLIIDMQNDFVKEDGSVRVESAKETIPLIKSLLNEARRNKVKVCYTQDPRLKETKNLISGHSTV